MTTESRSVRDRFEDIIALRWSVGDLGALTPDEILRARVDAETPEEADWFSWVSDFLREDQSTVSLEDLVVGREVALGSPRILVSHMNPWARADEGRDDVALRRVATVSGLEELRRLLLSGRLGEDADSEETWRVVSSSLRVGRDAVAPIYGGYVLAQVVRGGAP
jgi:hypothetical protein